MPSFYCLVQVFWVKADSQICIWLFHYHNRVRHYRLDHWVHFNMMFPFKLSKAFKQVVKYNEDRTLSIDISCVNSSDELNNAQSLTCS